jgi:hypothetical protein
MEPPTARLPLDEFHIWADLLPETRGEIRDWLDPLCACTFSLVSKEEQLVYRRRFYTKFAGRRGYTSMEDAIFRYGTDAQVLQMWSTTRRRKWDITPFLNFGREKLVPNVVAIMIPLDYRTVRTSFYRAYMELQEILAKATCDPGNTIAELLEARFHPASANLVILVVLFHGDVSLAEVLMEKWGINMTWSGDEPAMQYWPPQSVLYILSIMATRGGRGSITILRPALDFALDHCQPLDICRKAFELDGNKFHSGTIEWAVRGGRCDVIDWLYSVDPIRTEKYLQRQLDDLDRSRYDRYGANTSKPLVRPPHRHLFSPPYNCTFQQGKLLAVFVDCCSIADVAWLIKEGHADPEEAALRAAVAGKWSILDWMEDTKVPLDWAHVLRRMQEKKRGRCRQTIEFSRRYAHYIRARDRLRRK